MLEASTWRPGVKEKDLMYRAVQAKFTQNTTLRAILCDSGDSQLAESSTDQYWGTSLHLHDRNVLDSRQWKNK